MVQSRFVRAQDHKLPRHGFCVELAIPVTFYRLMEVWMAMPDWVIIQLTFNDEWCFRAEMTRLQNHFSIMNRKESMSFISISRPVMVVVKPRNAVRGDTIPHQTNERTHRGHQLPVAFERDYASIGDVFAPVGEQIRHLLNLGIPQLAIS